MGKSGVEIEWTVDEKWSHSLVHFQTVFLLNEIDCRGLSAILFELNLRSALTDTIHIVNLRRLLDNRLRFSFKPILTEQFVGFQNILSADRCDHNRFVPP
jgi:hypothetical protein